MVILKYKYPVILFIQSLHITSCILKYVLPWHSYIGRIFRMNAIFIISSLWLFCLIKLLN